MANETSRQALDDMKFAVGQLRHLYAHMTGGTVSSLDEAARGLLSPSIAKLERALAALDAAPPSDERVRADERERDAARAEYLRTSLERGATVAERDALRAAVLDREARLKDLQDRYDNNRRTMLTLAAQNDDRDGLRATLAAEREAFLTAERKAVAAVTADNDALRARVAVLEAESATLREHLRDALDAALAAGGGR